MIEPFDVEIEQCRTRCWLGGEGFPVVFVHGVGPGTSVVGNFGPVLEAMADRHRVVAIDLIGFGESDRKPDPPYFDQGLWIRQVIATLDRLVPEGPCGIAGHSLGGALALKVAARCPRVTHVLASSSIGAAYRLNAVLDEFWTLPADRAALRRVMKSMVFDPAAVGDDMIEARWRLLSAEGYAAYFEQMFAGDRQRFIDGAVLTDEECASIAAAVTLLHGRDDRPCPPEQTALSLAGRLPAADVVLLGRCGHNLPRERTESYLSAAFRLFGDG